MNTDQTNVGYILDTTVLSTLLDHTHTRHHEITAFVALLNAGMLHVSAVSLGEMTFGVCSSEAFWPRKYPHLRATIAAAKKYPFLELTKHTSDAFAELKTNLAKVYMPSIAHKKPPRWLEDWSDEVRGQKLQVDENDLWLCAQAKERGLTLLTTDKRIERISNADEEARIKLI